MKNQLHLSRRDFIKIAAVAGGALVGGKLTSDLLREIRLITVQETRLLMGTIINLTVVAENKSAGEAAVAATFAELERQVAIFTHRAPNSPVAVLNSTGSLGKPPQELVEVLSQAIKISEITTGAFDVTIKPLVDLYQRAQPDLPGTDAIELALSLVDYTQLIVSDSEISFAQPGMAITLDGIAKGYIVDAGTDVLKELGFENVYVEAGGDLMASGKKVGDVPWKIGIRSPREEQSSLLAQINVSDKAVATSGDYFQYYSADMINHHIIDPRIGNSPKELASVTVIASTCLQADALATALTVLGKKKGIELIEILPEVEAFLVTKELNEYQSTGFEIR